MAIHTWEASAIMRASLNGGTYTPPVLTAQNKGMVIEIVHQGGKGCSKGAQSTGHSRGRRVTPPFPCPLPKFTGLRATGAAASVAAGGSPDVPAQQHRMGMAQEVHSRKICSQSVLTLVTSADGTHVDGAAGAHVDSPRPAWATHACNQIMIKTCMKPARSMTACI